MSTCYLAKFRPLVSTREGQLAAKRYGLPRYIDGSCRREPDLESPFPSICSICRGPLFAPRLRKGDSIVYLTCLGPYDSLPPHWRLVAFREVIKECVTHAEAAEWYRAKGLPLPSDCMVEGNDPMPLGRTVGAPAGCGCGAKTLAAWDARYRLRAQRWPEFLVCETLWKELNSPPILSVGIAEGIFGGPSRARQRAPLVLTAAELDQLKKVMGKAGQT